MYSPENVAYRIVSARDPWNQTIAKLSQKSKASLLTQVAVAEVVFSQRRQLKKMVELPRKTRVVWSGCLWAFLSTMTVFDTSGNAIGYPVFFGFVLTYMRRWDAAKPRAEVTCTLLPMRSK